MAETETEDRTQAPSARRLQEARDRGQVAYSPELSSAAGLLAAAAVLWTRGEPLASALASTLRAPLTGPIPITADVGSVVAHLRGLALEIAWPIGQIVAAFALAAAVAHLAQTRLLWTPGRLAPDVARLWAVGQGGGLGDRLARGAWSLARACLVVAVAAWFVRNEWLTTCQLADAETPVLARVAGQSLGRLLFTLSAATLALGVVDLLIQQNRFQAMLSQTPDEQREDLRSTEGDPTLRSRRRRAAEGRRIDPAELLSGASLVLTGASGLSVVLGGGPPPIRFTVRSVAHGLSGDQLRRAAIRSGLLVVSAPDLALTLSRRRSPTPEQLTTLTSLWPVPPSS